MPKFYFNIRDDRGLIQDEEGVDLPDADAAREEAELGAREILAEAIKNGKEADSQIVEIASESGEVIAAVKVRDLLSEAHRIVF